VLRSFRPAEVRTAEVRLGPSRYLPFERQDVDGEGPILGPAGTGDRSGAVRNGTRQALLGRSPERPQDTQKTSPSIGRATVVVAAAWSCRAERQCGKRNWCAFYYSAGARRQVAHLLRFPGLRQAAAHTIRMGFAESRAQIPVETQAACAERAEMLFSNPIS
jgi:hypothetical protein